MLPRLVPEREFPAYTFVPGRDPHPIRDPRGHSHGRPHVVPQAPTLDDWASNRSYLFGIDLFNHGYYWEAHEEWEGLWHACGRTGTIADFLKGLIQLTAAGVKVRQGVPQGVVSLARGAAELFTRVAVSHARLLGLDVEQLRDFAEDLAAMPQRDSGTEPISRVLTLVLLPDQR